MEGSWAPEVRSMAAQTKWSSGFPIQREKQAYFSKGMKYGYYSYDYIPPEWNLKPNINPNCREHEGLFYCSINNSHIPSPSPMCTMTFLWREGDTKLQQTSHLINHRGLRAAHIKTAPFRSQEMQPSKQMLRWKSSFANITQLYLASIFAKTETPKRVHTEGNAWNHSRPPKFPQTWALNATGSLCGSPHNFVTPKGATQFNESKYQQSVLNNWKLSITVRATSSYEVPHEKE